MSQRHIVDISPMSYDVSVSRGESYMASCAARSAYALACKAGKTTATVWDAYQRFFCYFMAQNGVQLDRQLYSKFCYSEHAVYNIGIAFEICAAEAPSDVPSLRKCLPEFLRPDKHKAQWLKVV